VRLDSHIFPGTLGKVKPFNPPVRPRIPRGEDLPACSDRVGQGTQEFDGASEALRDS